MNISYYDSGKARPIIGEVANAIMKNQLMCRLGNRKYVAGNKVSL